MRFADPRGTVPVTHLGRIRGLSAPAEVCSRLVFWRQGHALVVALVLLLAVLLGRGVSPVNIMLTRLQNAPDSLQALLPTGVLPAVATGLLAPAAALTQAITGRTA
ncbi:hypothetical protein [Streptomyces sp. NPDC091268]|uniref:hypothetical protein n=1 Tax=Streptomyces sp. NPDC091268 TaxID=3365979 RepID=UPI003822E8B2